MGFNAALRVPTRQNKRYSHQLRPLECNYRSLEGRTNNSVDLLHKAALYVRRLGELLNDVIDWDEYGGAQSLALPLRVIACTSELVLRMSAAPAFTFRGSRALGPFLVELATFRRKTGLRRSVWMRSHLQLIQWVLPGAHLPCGRRRRKHGQVRARKLPVASDGLWPSSAGDRTVPNGGSSAHRRRSSIQGLQWREHPPLSLCVSAVVDDPLLPVTLPREQAESSRSPLDMSCGFPRAKHVRCSDGRAPLVLR